MDPALTYQLCLDLGKARTGYAGMDSGRLTFYGSVSHRFSSDADLFHRTYTMLGKLSRRIESEGKQVGCITFEAAEKQAGRAAEVYFTMATAVKVWAAKHDIPVFKVYSSSMKKHITGNGRADKPTVVRHINRKFGTSFDEDSGPYTKHDDMADAIAVGSTAIELFRRDMLKPSP